MLRITTIPLSLKVLLRGQLAHFQSLGYDVLAVSSDGPEIIEGEIDGTPHATVRMTRKITPLADLFALIRLIGVIRKFSPHIVHTHTPKAGLLGMMAAWICRVPVRMHTVAGLPLMESRGFRRRLLIWVERLTYACATNVYPNSTGLRAFMQTTIGYGEKTRLIGKGSSNGIDTAFFSRTPALLNSAQEVRRLANISADDFVISFVGRVVRDKGIAELVSAFRRCRNEFPKKRIVLLIVGPMEQDLDPLDPADLKFLTDDKDVVLAGYQKDVRPYLLASDLFVFPSYREGFPNVVMQACCLDLPCIVSDINGSNEIIVHGVNGLIVPAKNDTALVDAIGTLLTNESLRLSLASSARATILQNFDQQFVWAELEKEYQNQLSLSVQTSGVYARFVKPLFDFSVAFVGLTLASPVILICILLLAVGNKGKVWFTQPRPGLHGRIFKVIKFKTMSDERDASGKLLPDEKRLHAIGRFIRKSSLDELPQLINVLKGDMSIVGPRPLLEEYLPLYNAEQAQRHFVKPGITGWAQVNGRNAISWQQKFAFDVWYVRNLSFLVDMKIILLTILKVFKAEGISSATSMTMEKFRGNNA